MVVIVLMAIMVILATIIIIIIAIIVIMIEKSAVTRNDARVLQALATEAAASQRLQVCQGRSDSDHCFQNFLQRVYDSGLGSLALSFKFRSLAVYAFKSCRLWSSSPEEYDSKVIRTNQGHKPSSTQRLSTILVCLAMFARIMLLSGVVQQASKGVNIFPSAAFYGTWRFMAGSDWHDKDDDYDENQLKQVREIVALRMNTLGGPPTL